MWEAATYVTIFSVFHAFLWAMFFRRSRTRELKRELQYAKKMKAKAGFHAGHFDNRIQLLELELRMLEKKD